MYRVSAQGVDKGRGSTDSSFHTHNMVTASFQCGNLPFTARSNEASMDSFLPTLII